MKVNLSVTVWAVARCSVSDSYRLYRVWRVVAGRIRRGRGPDAARGPPVGHP